MGGKRKGGRQIVLQAGAGEGEGACMWGTDGSALSDGHAAVRDARAQCGRATTRCDQWSQEQRQVCRPMSRSVCPHINRKRPAVVFNAGEGGGMTQGERGGGVP